MDPTVRQWRFQEGDKVRAADDADGTIYLDRPKAAVEAAGAD